MELLPLRKGTVAYREVADGAVLLSTDDEVYFGLNHVGRRVWQLLPPELETLDELCRELGRLYPDVEVAVLRADVQELLDQLIKEGLVQPR